MEPSQQEIAHTPHINDQLLRKVSRQLRSIKIMLGFFFFMIIAMLAILGFIAFKVITFTQDVTDRIDKIQTQTTQSLDIKSKLCDNSALSNFIGDDSICK